MQETANHLIVWQVALTAVRANPFVASELPPSAVVAAD